MTTPKEALERALSFVETEGGEGSESEVAVMIRSALASFEGDAVERVARIMARELCDGVIFDECADIVKMGWRKVARRILATGLAADEAAVRADSTANPPAAPRLSRKGAAPMSDDLVSGWSCDQRHRGNGCRDPHGCHCREITAQNADIAVKDLAVAEAARSMHKLMTRALAAESELSTLRAHVREVVGPFSRLDISHTDDIDDSALVFENEGGNIVLGHLRAARQLMEEVK